MSADEHSVVSIAPALQALPFRVVAIATSRGGLVALSEILAGLPYDFPAAILVLQHLSSDSSSLLVDLLARRSRLHLKWAVSGESLHAGTVYVAPPNRHTRVTGSRTVEFVEGERVRFCRPSADILFRSVAHYYAEQAIAIVLTGALDDGAAGLAVIKERGGTTIAQSPPSCDCASMPLAAIRTGAVGFILPLHEIANALVTLAHSDHPPRERSFSAIASVHQSSPPQKQLTTG